MRRRRPRTRAVRGFARRPASRGLARPRAGVLAVALALAASMSATPSLAIDRGNVAKVGPANKRHTQTFGSLTGTYQGTTVHPFAAYRPENCRRQTYCDAVLFTIEIPPNYREFFGVRVTLSWPNPSANDVDLFVWPDDHPTSGAPMGPCGNPQTAACNSRHPESFDLIEPDPGTVYMTVVNHSGLNSGYTVDIQFFTFTVPEPAVDRPNQPAPVVPRATKAPAAAPKAGSFATESLELETPKPATRKVRALGPDGEPIEIELPVLAAGNRAPAPDAGLNPLVPAAAALVVVGGGAGAVLWWRRKRAALVSGYL